MGFVRLACGERGHLGERATAAVDAQQYRKNEGADEAPGFRLRLVARGHHVFAGILPLEPVVLPQVLRARPGLPQDEQSQLVPEVLHRFGQRTGFLRITRYADELLRDLDKLDGWPEKVRTMQRNWIGRSEGTLVDFKLADAKSDGPSGSTISVFTTRVDTIFGATSVQLAPEHPIVVQLAASNTGLRAKVDQLIAEQRKAKEAGDIGEIEKHGVPTGSYAINPFNGEKVPIWVANYILMDYGTGAIMSVPAHDERDYEFAR